MIHKKKPEKNELSHLTVESNSNGHNMPDLSRRLLSRNKTILILLVVVFVAMLVMGILIYSSRKHTQTTPTPSTSTPQDHLLSNDRSSKNQHYVAQHFNKEFQSSYTTIMKSDPTKWDSDTLNKAYLSLLYADKIEAFTQVYNMLGYIDAAQKNGVNVDDNKYGVTKQMRDSILKRAIAAQKEVSNNDK